MLLTKRPQALIFDLDGTLAHTLPQLAVAVCAVAREMGVREPTDAEMATYVGNGVPMLLSRALLGQHDVTPEMVGAERLEEARRLFFKFYLEGLSENYVIYEGLVEGIREFHKMGIRMSVATNKPQIFVQPLLGFMGLISYFEIMLGGDTLPEKKPSPMPVLHVLEKMGIKAEDAVMVGDSINDVLAGQRAGTHTVAFTYGYNGGYDLHTDCHADYLFDTFGELTALMRSLPE